MKVKRSALVALFQALDFKTADKWNKARLVGRIQGLKEIVDDETDVGEHQELLNDLLDAVEADTDIEIQDDIKSETGDAATAPKAAPKKKASANAAPKVRDFLGNGTETQCSKINHALSTTPQQPDAISAACGVSLSLVKSHTKTLHGKGLIVRNDEGFFLDDATAAKHPALPTAGKKKKAKVETDSEDNEEETVPTPKKKTKPKPAAVEEETQPAKATKKPVLKKPAKGAKPAVAEQDGDE